MPPSVASSRHRSGIVIQPPKTIEFSLDARGHFTAILGITNPSKQAVLFKIKITNPDKYKVRPNYGLINPASTASVHFTLQEDYLKEVMGGLNEAETLGTSYTCSDRFLVQSFALPDELAASLSSMDSSATQQIGDLWKRSDVREQATNKRMSCSFSAPDVQVDDHGAASAEEAVELNAPEPSGNSRQITAPPSYPQDPTPAGSPAAGRDTEEYGGGVQQQMSQQELIELRQQYNDLVSFTVELTSERDGLAQRLETTESKASALQRKLDQLGEGARQRPSAKDDSQKQDARRDADSASDAAAKRKGVEGTAAATRAGFPLWAVLLLAVLAFLAGYGINL